MMTRESAVIYAAATLGKAATQLFSSGYRNLASDCLTAVSALQSSVAESRALDEQLAYLSRLPEHPTFTKLVDALTGLLEARTRVERMR